MQPKDGKIKNFFDFVLINFKCCRPESPEMLKLFH